MKIRTKLYAGFAVVISLTIGMGFITIRGIESVSRVASDTFKYLLMSRNFALSAQSNFIRMDRADSIAILTATEDAFSEQSEVVAELDALIREDLDIFAERMRNAEAPPLIAQILESLNDLAVLRNAQSRLLLAGTADVDELSAERMLLLADVNEIFEYLVDLSVEEGFDFLLNAEETAEGNFETQLIAIVALIGIGLLIAGLLSRSTVRPLSAITAVTTRLSKGARK